MRPTRTRRWLWTVVCLLMLALSHASMPSARGQASGVYYVSASSGNDGWAGTVAAPWRTLARAASHPFQPGDRLLLKRGDVWNEPLMMTASGTAAARIEVSAYGSGARPTIRRNGAQSDRCVMWTGGTYTRVSSLTVRDAGMGILLGGDGVIDDCIAINIKGLYGTPQPDGWMYSIGLGASTVTNSEGWGAGSVGGPTMDRLYIHDASDPGTTYAGTDYQWVTGGSITRCLYDRSVYSAAAGTSAIMFKHVRSVTVDNCIFQNTPHTGSADECGIDFEDDNQSVLIQNSVFKNNAGPAIEFLRGGDTQQVSSNVEIRGCKFILDNWAKTQSDPSEVQVVDWTSPNRPTGITIHDNQYTLVRRVRFFGGAGDKTGCTLWNNLAVGSIAYNHEPSVNAGADKSTSTGVVALSDASASDDGGCSVQWEQLSGPYQAAFDNASIPNTTARFPGAGTYELRLKADDGTFWKTDYVTVTVSGPNSVYMESAAYPGYRVQAAGNQYNGQANTHDILLSNWGPYNEQQLRLVNAGGGTFYLESVAFPGYRLQAAGNLYNGQANTHDVLFSNWGPYDEQQFRKIDAGGGAVYLESIAFPGYRLQAAGDLYYGQANTHDLLLSSYGPYVEQQFRQVAGP